jgi:hypothetical protein
MLHDELGVDKLKREVGPGSGLRVLLSDYEKSSARGMKESVRREYSSRSQLTLRVIKEN